MIFPVYEPEPMTPEREAAALYEARASYARAERNRRLSATDYMAMPDYPAAPAELGAYRQALRDLPAQAGFPETIVWPEMKS